jgi:Flp pilus assembly protein TadB
MDRLTAVRMVVIALGIIVWGYGVKVDDANLRVIGMGLLAAALVLRWVRRFMRKPPEAQE